MGFFAVLAASLFAVFLFTVFGGYSLLLWCQQSLLMVVPPAVVLAVLVWTFLKMDDKITALQKQVEELRRMERHKLPPDLDYQAIQGLRLEAREKLSAVRPLDLGQAGRISGVSPADIAALMIYLER